MYAGDSKSTCNVIDSTEYKVTTLVETALILIVYTITILRTAYKYGKSMSFQAYATILLFFITELVCLIIYIIVWT